MVQRQVRERSYLVVTAAGKVIRQNRHQLQFRPPFEDDIDDAVGHQTQDVNVTVNDAELLVGQKREEMGVRTRSGRLRLPAWQNEYV